jgi:diketogulonate reductase-like aldo/keto reductase
MKASVEQAFVAGELLVRTGRYLVVLTLPLVCWLAGQEYPAQALLAWVLQRGTGLLVTPRSAARARENFDISALPQDALDEINRIHTR